MFVVSPRWSVIKDEWFTSCSTYIEYDKFAPKIAILDIVAAEFPAGVIIIFPVIPDGSELSNVELKVTVEPVDEKESLTVVLDNTG